MRQPVPSPLRHLLLSGVALLAVGPLVAAPVPETQQGAPAAKPAAPAPSPSAQEAKKPDPGDPKPFEEVVRDAERIPGLLTFYRDSRHRLWLEVTPEMLEREYLLQLTAASGLGGREGGFTLGEPLYDVLFRFRRVQDQIFLALRQTNYRAREGEPIARAVRRSFGDSILAAFKVESQPHPERRSVLVNATEFFLQDHAAIAQTLSTRHRTTFSLDRGKSYIDLAKSFPENAEVEVAYHFAAPRPAGATTLADGRSAQVRVRFSFMELKETGYRPRYYDPRVGYFVTAFRDLTEDDPKEEFTEYILRWRLEKQDPSAPLSPPRRPIVFWLDDAIPLEYRKAVADGLLMWNRAFERIGIRDAIQVRQMEPGQEIDPFDIRYNTLRWVTSPGDGYAVALFRPNPLTGEIVKADIRVDASIVGFTRRAFRLEDELKGFDGVARPPDRRDAFRCAYAQEAAREAAFASAALELMALSDEPAERQRFVREYITEVVAHEMGHILGLRHNFKASTLHDPKDLHSMELTDRVGLVSSVMDYAPANLAGPGEKQGHFFTTTLGPYDLWAIEYGYREWPGTKSAEEERPYLARIASRAAEPALAYATDEDVADFGFAPYATDPYASRWDLSADPLAYAEARARMVRSLYARLEAKSPRNGESYEETRRKFALLLGQYLRTFRVAGKYIGGIEYTRARRGDPGAKLAPFTLVPAARQRAALRFLQTGLFSAEAFRFRPGLLNRLAIDKNWHWGVEPFGEPMILSVQDVVQAQQRAMLAWLLAPGLLARLRDNEARATCPSDTLTTAELFDALTGAIFSELRPPAGAKPGVAARSPLALPALRRELQQEYVTRLVALYTGGGEVPTDGRALARLHLRRILGELRAALARKPAPETTTRAHLELAAERIERALEAQATVSPG